MKHLYGAIVRKSDEKGYWAEVPDLPGCYGQGDTFVGAVASVSDAVATHLASLAAYHRDAPKATKVSASDGDVVYVQVDPDTVTLSEPMVSAAEAARRLSVTPARVSQLIKAGKLVAERDATGTSVTVASVESYAREPRLAGRPKRKPTALEA